MILCMCRECMHSWVALALSLSDAVTGILTQKGGYGCPWFILWAPVCSKTRFSGSYSWVPASPQTWGKTVALAWLLLVEPDLLLRSFGI